MLGQLAIGDRIFDPTYEVIAVIPHMVISRYIVVGVNAASYATWEADRTPAGWNIYWPHDGIVTLSDALASALERAGVRQRQANPKTTLGQQRSLAAASNAARAIASSATPASGPATGQ